MTGNRTMLGLTHLLLRRVSAGLVDVIPDLLKDQMLAPVGALLDSAWLGPCSTSFFMFAPCMSCV